MMLESLMTDLIQRNRVIYSDTNPYVPDTFRPSNDLKRKIKASTNCVIDNKKSFIRTDRTEPDSVLMIQDESENPDSTTASADISSSTGSSIENSVVATNNAGSKSFRSTSQALTARVQAKVPIPQWHANWELGAVVSGHLGWVRSIAFDPSNEWFVTGSVDRTIKVWDLAKCCAGSEGGLKLTLTGHVHAVRALAVSSRSPFIFSAGEDKLVKCWDMEQNKVIRHFHGHLSGVFCLKLHPTLDLLVTGGRDSVARVWDIRTKHQIHVLGGHTNAVSSLLTNGVDPQVITGSHDSTIKLWDLAAGKSMSTLTQHKKAIRSLCANPREFTFLSGGADNIKKWQCRDGKFLRNFSGHNSPINAVAINEDGVAVSCGDNGSINFWDYESGYCFQKSTTIAQPGSLDAECGIYAASFDLSGSRLITCEADKTIKIWKENALSTEESDPIDMKAWSRECLSMKKY